MTLEEARKITNIWGRYLEYCAGRLNMIFLFGGKIPESLLPHSKSELSEALNIMFKHFTDTGDKHRATSIRETMTELQNYEDDEQALRQAGKSLSDDEKIRQVVTSIKNWQKEWIKTQ